MGAGPPASSDFGGALIQSPSGTVTLRDHGGTATRDDRLTGIDNTIAYMIMNVPKPMAVSKREIRSDKLDHHSTQTSWFLTQLLTQLLGLESGFGQSLCQWSSGPADV